jgi:hypothetical protein
MTEKFERAFRHQTSETRRERLGCNSRRCSTFRGQRRTTAAAVARRRSILTALRHHHRPTIRNRQRVLALRSVRRCGEQRWAARGRPEPAETTVTAPVETKAAALAETNVAASTNASRALDPPANTSAQALRTIGRVALPRAPVSERAELHRAWNTSAIAALSSVRCRRVDSLQMVTTVPIARDRRRLNTCANVALPTECSTSASSIVASASCTFQEFADRHAMYRVIAQVRCRFRSAAV